MVTEIEVKDGRVMVGRVLDRLEELVRGRRVIVVTDVNVARIYGAQMALWPQIVLPGGEECKTMTAVEIIHRRMIELGADRRTFVVGFGGGIVTDIAGFAASTFMRGVDFGFVATTLLAQVDASVGGKNGVNVGGFKNMAGVFNQPRWVLCDTDVLKTLPLRELRAGIAEMIKAGIVGDARLFELLENGIPDDLAEVIERSIRVKARIVEADEREAGERRKLNLGHTVGHAIEKLTREFNHGEAVAIGLATIARMSSCTEQICNRILVALRAAGLPTDTDIAPEQIMAALAHDKKVDGDSLHLVLVRDIGEVEVKTVPLSAISLR